MKDNKNKNLKTTEKHTLCLITGKEITEHDDVLRLMVESDSVLSLSLTHKKHKNSVHILLNKQNVNHLRQIGFSHFGEAFKDIPNSEADLLVSKILVLYEKKICASLGFALKTKRAIVGQRAIERFLLQSPQMVGSLIIACGASQEIAHKMQSLTSIPSLIKDFPLEWLQQMTGKEKISYLLLHSGDMNKKIAKDYKQYCLFSKIKDL